MNRFIRAVSVMQLPKAINREGERVLLSEMRKVSDANRPRIVLNCANLHEVDAPAVRLLLHCLEEAMKRNGDVRLAALPEPARVSLHLAGLGRLFKIFESDAEAIRSFQQHPALGDAVIRRPTMRETSAENAA